VCDLPCALEYRYPVAAQAGGDHVEPVAIHLRTTQPASPSCMRPKSCRGISPSSNFGHRRARATALAALSPAPDGAVPSRKTLQARSDRAEECVAISDRQRLGGAENGVELFVREPDRGHGQPPYPRKWFAATQKGARRAASAPPAENNAQSVARRPPNAVT